MKSLSGKCLVVWAMLMLSGAGARAQSQPELSVPIIDLLQYQRAKQKRREPPVPFRRYQMKRIRASKVLSDDDPRRIWGYHVGANGEYDKAQQPLYRLFKRKGGSSLAIVDRPDGPHRRHQRDDMARHLPPRGADTVEGTHIKPSHPSPLTFIY